MICIPKIGLVLNLNKDKSLPVAKKVINWFEQNSVDYLLEEKAASHLNSPGKSEDYDGLKKKADLIILFGGDGTFLHVAHHFIETNIPLLGINLGNLGFMTEIETHEIEKRLRAVSNGDYYLEKRMLLDANLLRESKKIFSSYALNDIVINREASARLINIQVYINDILMNSYRGDGLIVATPTGSTAYSLSAGGPIINPQIKALLITPICPHNLHIRPTVISQNERVRVIVNTEDGQMNISADGRYNHKLLNNDQVEIRVSNKEINFVKFPDRNFYTILHNKMNSEHV